MNWFIIVLILLAIFGSMMWMMPSPRQRAQAILRQKAMRSGFQVQITRILLPRALGEALADERDCVAYRIPRLNSTKKSSGARASNVLVPWQIFRLQSHANEGLPSDWSWSKGEGQLEPTALTLIAELIETLPDDVYGLESTPVNASVYWEEHGTPEAVELIQQQLTRLVDAAV
ncbi:MAG: hypothetical protein V7707_14770 [Motiliproteus sp.]